MPDNDNSIEVNLQLFQEQELDRLAQFSDDFFTSVELLDESMRSHVDRIANASATGAQQTSSGQSRATGVGYETKTHAESVQARDAEVKTKQANTFHRLKLMQSIGNDNASRILGQQVKASAAGGMGLQSAHVAATGGMAAPDPMRGAAGVRQPFWSQPDEEEGGSIIAPFLKKHQRTMEQAGLAYAGGNALMRLNDLRVNNKISQMGTAMGYERAGAFGTRGFKQGLAQTWEAKKAGWFGLNPFVQGEDELAQTFANLGWDQRRPNNAKMYDQLIDMGKKWGIDTNATAEFIEGTKRFHPEDLGKVMGEIDKLGESARKAGMGVEAFRQGVMQGSEALSQQFGLGRSNFMTGLRKFGEETGMNPMVGAQLAQSQWAWVAAQQKGGGFGGYYNALTDPTSILESTRPAIESVLGTNLADFDGLSKAQKESIKGKYAALQSGDAQFREMTGGMAFEQLMSGNLRAGSGITYNADAASEFIREAGFFGDANNDGKGGVSKGELNKALSLYYGDDTKGMDRFSDMYSNLNTEEKAKELANMVGAGDAYSANKIEWSIKMAGKAAEFFEVIDEKGRFDPMSTAHFLTNPQGAIAKTGVKKAGGWIKDQL